jgi:hypothetical protein
MEKITREVVENVLGKAKQKTKEVKTGLMIRQKKGQTIRVEQNVLEASVIFNTTEEEQKTGAAKRWMDKEQTKYIEISKNVNSELIKLGDVNLFLVCFLLLKHARGKMNKYTIETNYKQIGELLLLTDAGPNYQNIREGLDRLVSNLVKTNFWWDTISGERIVQSDFHFLEGVEKGEVEKLRIRINPKIVESMEKGYLKVLEEKKLVKMLKLRGYAKILALLFAKKLGIDQERTYTIMHVMELLGVKEKYVQYDPMKRNRFIKKVLITAIGKAADVLGYTIKIVVPGAWSEGIIVYPRGQKGKHHDLILGKVVFEKNQPALFEVNGL